MWKSAGPLLHRHDDDAAGHSHGSGHSHEHQAEPGTSRDTDAIAAEGAADGEASLVVLDAEPEAHRTPLPRGAGHGKVLHFDAFSGVAGDMCVAALVDLGVPFSVVQQAVDCLGLEGVHLGLRSVLAGAIGATKFDVLIEAHQPQRDYRQIRQLLQSSSLSDGTRELALGVFARLAAAEARVHRTAVEDVHFHEVGAVDSLADIVGAAACLDYLQAQVTCSPLPLGSGMVECQHGLIPIPAPATLLCLEGLDTVDSALQAELVTPTGAAIVGHVARSSRWPSMRPVRVGWGRGTRSFPDRPNALRVVLGEPAPTPAADSAEAETHVLVEANLDDTTGELMADAIDALLRAGAVDAWATPNVMKKGRPGWTLAALGERRLQSVLADAVLRETSTIGVRMTLVRRAELARTTVEVTTPFGRVSLKVSGARGSAFEHCKPEFDVCQQLARRHGVPTRVVIEAALAATRLG